MRTDDFDKNLAVNTDINEHGIVWLDAKNEPFLLSGVHYDKKRNAYYRMPQDIAEKVNSGVEWLNSNTAGGRLRFSTDSDYIAIRAVMRNIPPMPHMPLSGQSGFDIYIKNGSSSVYLNTFMPPMGMNEGYSSGLRLDGKMHEYIINFPLYDRVDELYVALKKDSALFPGSDYKYKTPVVYYGSSITQGGCASRPGNSYQAMISRALDTEFINLGFSGSCKAEDIMSEYLSTLDMSVFVYDYDHNTPSPEYLRETHKRLFDKIRSARTELPVIIVSAPDIMLRGGVFTERRAIVKATYDAAKAAGDRNVYFVDGNSLFAEDMFDSCTVDGCHPNDLGFYRMARKIGEAVKTVLEK